MIPFHFSGCLGGKIAALLSFPGFLGAFLLRAFFDLVTEPVPVSVEFPQRKAVFVSCEEGEEFLPFFRVGQG